MPYLTYLVRTRNTRKLFNVKSIIIKLNENEFCAKKINFFDRILGNLRGLWIFYVIIFFGTMIISSLAAAVPILLAFLIWNIAEYYSWSKYHLIHIVLSEGKLKVEYLQKDELKTVEDQKGKFFFEKRRFGIKAGEES